MPRGIYKTDVRVQYSIDKAGVMRLCRALAIAETPPGRSRHRAGMDFGDPRSATTCGRVTVAVVGVRPWQHILLRFYVNDMLTALQNCPYK